MERITHVTPAVLADAFHALGDLAGRGRLRHTGGQWVVEGRDHQYLCETVAWAMDVESTKAAPDIHGRMCRWWIGTLAGVPVRVLTTVDDGELLWPRPEDDAAEALVNALLAPDREVSA